jgi:hypothetical protein
LLFQLQGQLCPWAFFAPFLKSKSHPL